ncbi:carbohydrate binding domain-containing protein [Agromyces bracchium]|uniref:Family 16 glycosylhydrolase n=1 Tax=Agromyces bracchium TaxID=88376 RepID=A0A6I3MCJ7_9MICO|nr:carbohydrate binding domain-containing protein [Agromyces bracchium]MTH68143.1 family 16 glycosylhydrolase [Agromyces bracchium]
MDSKKRALSRRTAATLAAAAVVAAPLAAAAPASAAGSISVLADFEGGAPDGFFSYGAAGFGIVDVAADSPDAKPGQTDPTKVVSYGWDVTAPGSFGGVGQTFAGARDVSAFDGVTLMVDGSGNGASYQVELFDGGPNADASERFDVDLVDDTGGWKEVRLPWSAFTRATDFQPGGAPDDGLGLTTLWGYAIPAVNGADTIRVDDIAVYSDADLTPSVSFSAAAASAIEGDALDVEVRLDLASDAPVTVELGAVDGTATLADGDYADPAATVEFAPGETTRTIQVATTGDDVEESDETFTLGLAAPSGAQLGSVTALEVTILDDDGEVVGPPSGRAAIVDDHESPLVRGDAGGIPVGWFEAQDPSSTVAFERTDAPPAPVPGAPDGNDVLRADFDVTSFGVVVRNFTNEAADAWTTQDWSTYEGIGFWQYGNGSGTDLFLDLLDNRNPGSTTDDAERFVVSYEDDWRGWKFLTFDFADFSRKNIGNNAPNDGLTLTEMHGYAFGSLRTTTPQTFLYDDVLLYGEVEPPALSVGFDRAGYEVTEGDTLAGVIRLNRVAETDVTVAYESLSIEARTATEDLSATADRDFTPVSGTVTIPAGEREATIELPTLQDGKNEVDETFVVRLSDPQGAEFGFVRTATVSIQDDDLADPTLVEDFEATPWLYDTTGKSTLTTREIAADSGDGYEGQDAYENVADFAYKGESTLGRGFAGGEDWSDAEGLSFWVNGSAKATPVTVEIQDDPAPDDGPGTWELAWSDEFDGPAGAPANPENWTYETGGWGWGNDELQYYTDSTDNAGLDGDGNLVITAREVDGEAEGLECWYGPCEYTSARLITEQKQKQEFEYGRIESRVQLPEGSGIWPAVWSLGTDFREVGWPQTGEIDIMEYVGRLPNEIFGTIHGPGYSGGQSYGGIYDFGQPVPEGWHEFAVEWTPEEIVWSVDGIEYHEAVPADVAPNEWVFDHPFSLITNIAVGGNFGGALGDDLEFPQSLTVDYVRVYQAPDTAERFTASTVVRGTGWQQVTIPFDAFERADEQPDGAPDDGLTLTDVQGYSLTFAGKGTASIDRVTVD